MIYNSKYSIIITIVQPTTPAIKFKSNAGLGNTHFAHEIKIKFKIIKIYYFYSNTNFK